MVVNFVETRQRVTHKPQSKIKNRKSSQGRGEEAPTFSGPKYIHLCRNLRRELCRIAKPPPSPAGSLMPSLLSFLALWSTSRFFRIFKAVQSNSKQTFSLKNHYALFPLHPPGFSFLRPAPSLEPRTPPSFALFPSVRFSLPKSKIKTQKSKMPNL
jgi:hypothetical protein